MMATTTKTMATTRTISLSLTSGGGDDGGLPTIETTTLGHTAQGERIEAPECAELYFGQTLLDTWFRHNRSLCEDIMCYTLWQYRHTAADTICELRNLRFLSDAKFHGSCSISSAINTWHHILPQGVDANWFQLEKQQQQHADNITILFVRRDCNNGNPFHCFGDLINLYNTMRMFRIPFRHPHVYLAFVDQLDGTPWLQMWHSMVLEQCVLFHYNPRHASHPTRQVSRLIFVGLSGSNFIWRDIWKDTPCPYPSPLLQDFAAQTIRFLLRLSTATAEPHNIITTTTTDKELIVFVVRRNAKQRMIANEDALHRALQRAFPAADVVRCDFAAMPLAELARLLQRCRLLVGMHGAGLTLQMFLPPGAALLEFHHLYWRQYVYSNMAAWLDVSYACWMNHEQVRAPNDSYTIVDTRTAIQHARQLLSSSSLSPASDRIRIICK